MRQLIHNEHITLGARGALAELANRTAATPTWQEALSLVSIPHVVDNSLLGKQHPIIYYALLLGLCCDYYYNISDMK